MAELWPIFNQMVFQLSNAEILTSIQSDELDEKITFLVELFKMSLVHRVIAPTCGGDQNYRS